MSVDDCRNAQEHLYKLWADDLDLCGCGYPDDAWTLIHELLRLFGTGEFGYRNRVDQLVGTRGAAHIVLGALEHAGLTEHGTDAYGAWLTGKGRWALWALNTHGHNDDVGYPHDGQDECTDTCWTPPADAASNKPDDDLTKANPHLRGMNADRGYIDEWPVSDLYSRLAEPADALVVLGSCGCQHPVMNHTQLGCGICPCLTPIGNLATVIKGVGTDER